MTRQSSKFSVCGSYYCYCLLFSVIDIRSGRPVSHLRGHKVCHA